MPNRFSTLAIFVAFSAISVMAYNQTVSGLSTDATDTSTFEAMQLVGTMIEYLPLLAFALVAGLILTYVRGLR
jgi:hypothetical protein